MNIGIVGVGVVGGACKYGFEKLGYRVLVHDLKLNTKLKDLCGCEIIYICVPTPSMADGSCDVRIVESIVDELKQYDYKGIVAIKSTVLPTTTENLANKTNLNICFVPEFLRERCAIVDFTENHDILAIGTKCSSTFEVVKKSHGSYPKNIIMLDPTEAEILKYYSNIFNALKITFANEMYEICKFLNVDYSKIKNAFVKRGTCKDIYLDANENFRGYAGVCLPKDTKAIDYFVKKHNLNLKLFETIDCENSKFKKTVFEGMRLD
jgi:UDPglucose 6-dehydrogenase